MEAIVIGGGIALLIAGGAWVASSLTCYLAPQNQTERDLDDADQLAYLKQYAEKHKGA